MEWGRGRSRSVWSRSNLLSRTFSSPVVDREAITKELTSRFDIDLLALCNAIGNLGFLIFHRSHPVGSVGTIDPIARLAIDPARTSLELLRRRFPILAEDIDSGRLQVGRGGSGPFSSSRFRFGVGVDDFRGGFRGRYRGSGGIGGSCVSRNSSPGVGSRSRSRKVLRFHPIPVIPHQILVDLHLALPTRLPLLFIDGLQPLQSYDPDTRSYSLPDLLTPCPLFVILDGGDEDRDVVLQLGSVRPA